MARGPKKPRRKVRTSVSIPAEHHEILVRLAEKEDKPVASLIREAVKRYVNEKEPRRLFS